MQPRTPRSALLLVAVACRGSESEGTAATGAASSSADGATTSAHSTADSTASTAGQGTDDTSSASSSGAAPTTGVGDGSSSTSGDVTGGTQASSSDSGVAPWCVDHCACMTTTCAAFEGYPWTAVGDCESDCAAWGDAEAACFPMWCTMAAQAGPSATHLCEHGWNAYGLDECGA